MTTLTNSFEGGTNGTALSTGNTGGGSGNAFDAVNTTGSGSGIAFSTAQAMHGTVSAKLTYASGVSSNVYASWTTSMGAQAQAWFRFYIYITAHPSVNLRIWQSDISGSTLCSALFLTTSGTLAFNASGSTAFTTTAAVPLNTWYRLEGYCTGSTSAGQVSLSMYAGDSTSAVETDTSSASQNTGGTQNCYRFGSFAAITETSAFSYYIDDPGLSSTGPLGPSTGIVPGAAALTGSGSFGSPLAGTFGGFTALTGSGSFGGTGNPVLDESGAAVLDESGAPVLDESPAGSGWTLGVSVALDGSGTMTATATAAPPGAGYANLSGTGTMTAARAITWQQHAALTGAGAMSVAFYGAQLSGTGTLGISGIRLSYIIALSGTGSLSIPQVSGGLVAGTGGAGTPYAMPGSSQVAVAPPGSSAWQWLGTLGQVTALTYSFVCPGGCDQMTCTVMVPAAYRTQLFNPGWQVRIVRGGHDVWHGKLDEPVPTSQRLDTDRRRAGQPGAGLPRHLLQHLARQPARPVHQQRDLARAAVDQYGCRHPVRGLVRAGGRLRSPDRHRAAQPHLHQGRAHLVRQLPARRGTRRRPVRLPAAHRPPTGCWSPPPRSPGRSAATSTPSSSGTESSADNATTGAAATYAITSVQNAQSVAAHGVIETYIDLSDVGPSVPHGGASESPRASSRYTTGRVMQDLFPSPTGNC